MSHSHRGRGLSILAPPPAHQGQGFSLYTRGSISHVLGHGKVERKHVKQGGIRHVIVVGKVYQTRSGKRGGEGLGGMSTGQQDLHQK